MSLKERIEAKKTEALQCPFCSSLKLESSNKEHPGKWKCIICAETFGDAEIIEIVRLVDILVALDEKFKEGNFSGIPKREREKLWDAVAKMGDKA